MSWLKNNETPISIFFYVIALVLVVYGLFDRAMFFEQMMHNVDLVFNIVKDPIILDNAVDWYAVGQSITLKDMWIVSMTAIRGLPVIFLSLGFILGFIVAGLLNQAEFKYEGFNRRKSIKVP